MRRTLFALAALAATLSSAHAQICTPFTDVPANDPFCASMQWMFDGGITFGCQTPGQPLAYCPAQFVRRDQMSAFMKRLADKAVFQQDGNAFGVPGVLGTTDTQPLEIIANTRVMRYEPNAISPNVIGGNSANFALPGVRGATIGGGGVPSGTIEPDFIGEAPNRVTDAYGTVGGGYANQAGDNAGTTIDRPFATVAGGRQNTASGEGSTVAGGRDNVASGLYSTVAGGRDNVASGDFSFAAGLNARATTDGSFVWADSSGPVFTFPDTNFFGVRATGGVNFTIAINNAGGGLEFCRLQPGVLGWICISDRDGKENLEPVRGDDILARLAAMPVYTWNFKGADPALRNLGPAAQDFQAAFGLGSDARTIASGNLHGVALAAIQGLNAKLEARVADQAHEIATLKERLAELDRAVQRLTGPTPQR